MNELLSIFSVALIRSGSFGTAIPQLLSPKVVGILIIGCEDVDP